MEVTPQFQLNFHGVDIPVINLQADRVLPSNHDQSIVIEISSKVFYPNDEPNFFKIIQEITLSLENYFNLSVVAFGTFEFVGTIDEHIRKSFVNLNAPAIMFPYVRSFITTLTSNLGNTTGTLTIPPQFFKGEIQVVDTLEPK